MVYFLSTMKQAKFQIEAAHQSGFQSEGDMQQSSSQVVRTCSVSKVA